MIPEFPPATDKHRLVQPASITLQNWGTTPALGFTSAASAFVHLLRFHAARAPYASYETNIPRLAMDEYAPPIRDHVGVRVGSDLARLHLMVSNAAFITLDIPASLVHIERQAAFWDTLAQNIFGFLSGPIVLKVLRKRKGPFWLRIPWLLPPVPAPINTRDSHVWMSTFKLSRKRSLLVHRLPDSDRIDELFGLDGMLFDDEWERYRHLVSAVLDDLADLCAVLEGPMIDMYGILGANHEEELADFISILSRLRGLAVGGGVEMGRVVRLPKNTLNRY